MFNVRVVLTKPAENIVVFGDEVAFALPFHALKIKGWSACDLCLFLCLQYIL